LFSECWSQFGDGLVLCVRALDPCPGSCDLPVRMEVIENMGLAYFWVYRGAGYRVSRCACEWMYTGPYREAQNGNAGLDSLVGHGDARLWRQNRYSHSCCVKD
jgi:hypothetical protein